MPVAKIHVHEGAFDDGDLSAIGLAVQAALEEVLSVPRRSTHQPTRPPPRSTGWSWRKSACGPTIFSS